MSSQYALLLLAAVVVIALLVVLAVVAGLKRSKTKQVSFQKPAEPKELTQEEKSGNYQAKGGFSFEAAGATSQEKQAQPLRSTQMAPSASLLSAETHSTSEVEVQEAQEAQADVQDEAVSDHHEDTVADETEESTDAVTLTSEPAVQAPEDEVGVPDEEHTDQPHEDSGSQESKSDPSEGGNTEEGAPAATVVDETPRDEIAPAAGRLGKLRGRLAKSNNVFGKSVLGMLSAGDLDEDAWEEIEDTLISADLGSAVTMKVVDKLREIVAERGVSSEEEARGMLREVLVEACQPQLDRSIKAMPYEGKPAVILMVGVNGTGKTTTTGKLGRVLVSMGHSVVFGAADTFRAAAADQLEAWGKRVGAATVRGKEGADPAAVAFDAVSRGIAENVDVVLIDTAGRLHTEVGLMDQLGKIKRVVEKKASVDEVLLVLDATVGQNGLTQARTFKNVVDITGVVLTKLDGSAKGGIVFQVQEELKVPVKLVGLGEGADDLAPFEVESFIDALLA